MSKKFGETFVPFCIAHEAQNDNNKLPNIFRHPELRQTYEF